MTNEEYEKIKAGAKFIRVGTKEICTYLCDLKSCSCLWDLKSCSCFVKFAAKIRYEDFESVFMVDRNDCIELLKTKYVKYILMTDSDKDPCYGFASIEEAIEAQITGKHTVARIEWEE